MVVEHPNSSFFFVIMQAYVSGPEIVERKWAPSSMARQALIVKINIYNGEKLKKLSYYSPYGCNEVNNRAEETKSDLN